MRILVTGSRGRLGRVICEVLASAGHEVRGCDLLPPVYDGGEAVESYFRADVTDMGEVLAAVAGTEAVVHAAGIPDVRFDPAQRVFAVNSLGSFHVAEAARVSGLRRIIYISSETVTGLRFSRTGRLPLYLPIDEDYPIEPEDAYAVSKVTGELVVAAACRGDSLTGVILRPCWIQYPDTYAANIEPVAREPELLAAGLWGYVDVRDVASAVAAAVAAEVNGSPACYLSARDNAAGRPLQELIESFYPSGIEVRQQGREGDGAAFSIARAGELLGWQPAHSWRDFASSDRSIAP